MKTKEAVNLFIRYLILIILAFPSFWIFYFIFTPLTVYPVYFLLDLFFNATLRGNTIFVNCIPIEIIGPCVAGSAYYFLSILNLAVPNIRIEKRMKMLLFSFSILLAANIIRIFSLSLVYINGISWFDVAHRLFWYAGSILFVILIWFAEVRIFRIKQIPIYSDVKSLWEKSSAKKLRKKLRRKR